MAEEGVADILDKLGEAGKGETVSVADVLQAFGRRAYGPLLFVIGLISFSPIGAIPGASLFFGTLTILLMGQFVVRSGSPWVPGWIERRAVGAKRFRQALSKARPWLTRIDALLDQRLTQLADPPWSKLLGGVAILAGISMFPLALVPWGVMLPSFALAVIGLGIAARDGLLLLAGWLAVAGTFASLWYLL